jgi:hypothetical protein
MGNEVSSYGDIYIYIYIYGILLLEMFIGKRLTDDMFQQSTLNLNSFVQQALSKRVVCRDYGSNSFLGKRRRKNMKCTHNNSSIRISKIQECLILMFKIGVACSVEQTGERMNMKNVVTEVLLIKKKLLETTRHGNVQSTRHGNVRHNITT